MRYLDEPEVVRAALSPIRRSMLELLREPLSASGLAEAMSVPRQRVNYHLKELEKAGLVELVEERQRRGFTERVFCARHDRLLVDPGVVGSSFAAMQDNYAAEHLVDVAADTVREVARMQAAAEAAGQRLLTFTIESVVRLAEPADLHRFAEALTDAVRRTVESFDSPDGRPHRLIAGAHPAPKARKHEGDAHV